MRVTFNYMYNAKINRMNQRSSALNDAVERASTGKRVLRPSSDPGAYNRILGKNTRLEQLKTYKESLEVAKNLAGYSDSALQSVQNDLRRIYELTLAGVTDTATADARAAQALEIRVLADSIRQVANTNYDGRAIFGGGASGEVFDSGGGYTGGDSGQEIIAGDGYTMTIALTGEEVFDAAGGVDVFTALDQVATALENNDPDTASFLVDDLTDSLDQISTARAFYGGVINQSDSLIGFYENAQIWETESRSDLAEVDMAEAYTDLNRLDSAYQSTLQVSAQVGKRSLFDYIQ